jgi:hypothetical protein
MIFDRENLRFNKFEGTKEFVLYSRDFVIAGLFYHKIKIKFFIEGFRVLLFATSISHLHIAVSYKIGYVVTM